MQIVAQIFKITILAVFFTLILQISAYAVSVNNVKTQPSGMTEVQNFSKGSQNNNKYKYKNSQVEVLGSVGAALATNIGIQYTKNTSQNQKARGELSTKGTEKGEEVLGLTATAGNGEHMEVIQEYFNILSTNLKTLIGGATDKASTLSAFTNQLEYRYKLSTTNIRSLITKRANHLQNLNSVKEEISRIKVKINSDFKNFDANATDKNIVQYLSLKKEYDFHRTHIIFINQYIKQYEFLNGYNKKVLDVLIINRDAIIKDSYVVIPDTGSEILKNMNLLITEREFKSE